ncbi:MAG: DUF2283 domain-containing protein [Armatimonadota bacterium]
MKITYDENTDVLRILITETPIETVLPNGADMTLDYDQDGMLVGLEMRHAERYLPNPGQVDVVVLPSMASNGTSATSSNRATTNGTRRSEELTSIGSLK